jgi:hypothetical protein
MAWLTLTDAKIAALMGMRIDVRRVVVGLIDRDGRLEVTA